MVINVCVFFYATFVVLVGGAAFLGVVGQNFLVEWMIGSVGCVSVVFPILLDFWGVVFASVVIFISSNVIYFSSFYMAGERFIQRFIYLVMLFIFSMMMLIFFPSMITLLLGWDGLGIVSFVLVIYYETPKSLAAGMVTALSNRVGDAMLLISIGWGFSQGHWSILFMWENTFSGVMCASVVLAAMTKSAQFPFSSWLPAAMAAPTPVSALVHSSTLVTAGVFLLIRFFPFISSVSWFCSSILWVGVVTMLVSGFGASVECDTKKIVAYSTLSQLGVMMASLGLGCPDLAMFHLLTHALFKALLFICVGGLIHFHDHSQDFRGMGNIGVQAPITVSCMSVANLSLCGAPFMAGFYSKDFILEFSLFGGFNFLALFFMFFATGLTAVYVSRLSVSVLWGPSNGSSVSYLCESDNSFVFPMVALTISSVIGGSVLNWVMFSVCSSTTLPIVFKLMALGVTFMGGWAGVSVGFINSLYVVGWGSKLHYAFSSLWFLISISSQPIVKGAMMVGSEMAKLDQSWVESVGGQGMKFLFSGGRSKFMVGGGVITLQLMVGGLLIVIVGFVVWFSQV